MNELKKCPFCTGAASVSDRSAAYPSMGRYAVYCKQCQSVTKFHGTKKEAIAAWNRRANSE